MQPGDVQWQKKNEFARARVQVVSSKLQVNYRGKTYKV